MAPIDSFPMAIDVDSLTVLGGHGFVGSNFVRHMLTPVDVILPLIFINDKLDYTVTSPNVINFISTVHNYNVFDDPYVDIHTNLNVLIKTLESWRNYLIQNDHTDKGCYNFISSWFVYGDQYNPSEDSFEIPVGGVPEWARCEPKGFYSITKHCAEQLLISYCKTYNLNYRILRLGNVVGPGDPKVSERKNTLQYLINKLKVNEPVTIYNNGEFYRDYIHVSDCVKAIEMVINNGHLKEIYNIGNGKGWIFKDIIQYCKDQLGSTSEVNFSFSQGQTNNVHSFYMNIDKLRSLGYSPSYQASSLYQSLVTLTR